MLRKLVVVCLSLLLFVSGAIADDNPEIQRFKKYIDLKGVGNQLISPDGSYVVYTVRQADWENNDFRSQIWLASLKDNSKRQMTFDEANKFSLDWAPCGKYFTFKKSVDGKTHLFRMAIDGGGAEQITDFEKGFGGYIFTKDGKKMYFSKSAEEDKTKDKIKEQFGSYHFHDVEYGRSELWVYDFESKEETKLVGDEDFSIAGFDLSPDESKILVTTQPDNKLINFDKQKIRLYDIESRELKVLLEEMPGLGGTVWSPCSKHFAFSAKDDETNVWFRNSHIFIYNLEDGEIKNLTADFDENTGPNKWRKEGIYFWAYQGMSAGLFLLNPATGDITKVTPDDGAFYGNFSFAKDAGVVSFRKTSATELNELWYSDLTAFDARKITDLGEQVEDWTLATKEKISWKSTDGATIQGVLTKPADFDPAKKYPLLVIIHGGPTGIDFPQLIHGYNSYAYPIDEWAAKGAVILQPNYRGSAGFGEEFRSLNYENLGVGDYWDVISGVDYLINQGMVDPEKVGAMGWSQGGYISAFITTFSDRFKAVSVGAGISDWVDYYYRTDITPFTVQYLGDDPWDDPKVYSRTSPMTHIKNAKTPTLIQHGENDARVPINNAYKLFRGLEDQGVPVYFAIYHGFGHGISNPKERLALIMHNWNFFNKYLWGEDVDVMKMPGTEEKSETNEEAEEKEEETEKAVS